MAWIATGSSGSGSSQGSTSAGRALLGQGVGGFSRCQLRHQDKITGDCVRLRPRLVAKWRRERTDPLIVAVMIGMGVDMVRCELLQMPADVQWSVGAERAGEDPDQGLSAGERVAGGAYHFGDQRTLRVDSSPGRRDLRWA